MTDFCHLHLHTEYSVLDGVGTSKQYSYRAREAGQTHIAITNHGNIDGILDHQKQCGISGVNPLAGCELYVVPDMYVKAKGEKRYHVTVLVENQTGWRNLLKLLTIANLEGFYHRPRVDLETLQQHLEGLVVLTGCSLSFLNMPGARKHLRNFVDVLGPERVYLEVMPHQLDEQRAINEKCLALRKHYGLRLVATNDCHYPSNRAAFYQEVLLAIQSRKKMADKDRWKFSVDGFYLKTRDEMVVSFKALGGLSPKQLAEALESTMMVAEMCEGFRVEKQEPALPSIGVPAMTDLSKIKEIVQGGFESRILQNDEDWLLRYRSRIEEELALISKAKFERYFLIVWDLIHWCRTNNILTGPGRGSVGGSLVAYLMGITDVDPIKYDLSFARFISPDRIDLPDIDMDFEDHKRHLVKKYLQDKYGEFNVAGLSTFMQMKGRGVITDVSRVYDVPLVEVKVATKAVDSTISENQVKEAFENSPECMRFKKKYPEVVEVAEGLEGQIRGCISGDCRLTLPKKSGEVGIRVKKIKHLYKESYRGKARAYDLSKDVLFFDDVIDIWPVGVKRVFDLSVGGSKKIRLTADHRLLTKRGWKEAENIRIGELVATNGVPWNKGLKGSQVAWNKGLKGKQVAWNKGLTKDDHPGVAIHSKRMKENNPSKLEHVKKLTSERSFKHGRHSIPPRYKAKHPVCEVCGVRKTEEVHHIDIDRYNNDESNLLAVCSKCHHEIHWSLSDQNLQEINPLRTVGWSKVTSFEFAGEEMVYDIEMKSSNQNFVCNKIVAHNCGQHAAAVCVSSVDLREGLNCNLAIRSGQVVANWDKDNAEYMGLIKLDILGLSALSILQSAKEMVQKNHGVEIDFNAIPLDDKKVYREINKGNTTGAFQIGARGLSKFCQELGVDDFGLLVAATALYRPGPLHSGMAEQFIKIKNGDAPVKKLTPGYDRITEDTFGIIVYQEQVMAIINQMSGIDMATCDKIRKLMAKSKGEEAINKYKEQFLEGCVVNGSCDKRLGNLIWKTILTFGKYGFNKAHSVEYSLITIWDMWLKTYYPGEFIAATLTHGGKDKCPEYLKEAGRLGLEVRLPKIGISHSTDWRIDVDRNLFAPFSAVGGIGEATAEAIAKYNPAAQKQHGFFLAAKQVSGKIPGVNKTVIEKLEKMGSFEPVGEISRAERALVKELLAGS